MSVSLIGSGEDYFELRSFSERARDIYLGIMLVAYELDDRKTQTGSFDVDT